MKFILCWLLSFYALNLHADVARCRPFTVYVFVPWFNAQFDDAKQRKDYFNYLGIKPIKVIYEAGFYTQGKVDPHKIRQIALESRADPDTPISFDFEMGNRFRPETVIPDITKILHYYRDFDSKARVGIYGTIPQNTYAWHSLIAAYDALNWRYKPLADWVDFLSPVLYNYDGDDFESWFKSAQYNVAAARDIASEKPIIPYISPNIRLGETNLVKQGHVIKELSEKAMAKRLQALYNLGASGCIIWSSSQDRTQDGQKQTFTPHQGWGRAVVEFIRTH